MSRSTIKNRQLAIKVCGMKHNTLAVAASKPEYLGFIFYENSARNYTDAPITLPSTIKKVGVFVDAPISYVATTAAKHQLDVLQLHGEESSDYIVTLKKSLVKKCAIWKVFSVQNTFNFEALKTFEPHVQGFLFDTKGEKKGGNGQTFNWSLLNKYPSNTPIILSGGIGIAEISAIKKLATTHLPIHAIDINSKFEIAPGLKDTEQIDAFIKQVNH